MKKGDGCRRRVNVKIGDHETQVALCEGAQFGVKEEVGDRIEGEEAWN